MSSVSFASFAKTRSCPSAEALLDLKLAGSTQWCSQTLISHLAECDFCGAEAHLLSRLQPSTSRYEGPTEMPQHLRLLAESLLLRLAVKYGR
jgi:hypothetical protein